MVLSFAGIVPTAGQNLFVSFAPMIGPADNAQLTDSVSMSCRNTQPTSSSLVVATLSTSVLMSSAPIEQH